MTIEIILSICFIFLMTTLGASLVFFIKDLRPNLNLAFDGLASGIMISSSMFSLIIPSLELNAGLGSFKFAPTAISILIGAGFITLLDLWTIKAHKAKVSRANKLFFAMTFHNIPEGLAVGVAFGSFLASNDPALLASAIGLAVGIGIQNFPEGFAVSMPIRASGVSKKKSFFMGMISGVVEPVFACLGILLAVSFAGVLPWLLALSAGSMIMVVVSELLVGLKGQAIGVWCFLIGFVLMLILDNL